MEEIQAIGLPLHPERRLLSVKAKGSEILGGESKYLFRELAFALGVHECRLTSAVTGARPPAHPNHGAGARVRVNCVVRGAPQHTYPYGAP